MTRKRKCHSKSNSFVAAAEQVCLQSVLEHRQRRGRRNIAWQAYTAKNLTEAISMAISNTGTDICILQPSVATC